MGERKHTYEDECEYFRLLHESPESLSSSFPLRGAPAPVQKSRPTARPVSSQRTHEKFILAGHLIITGYAH